MNRGTATLQTIARTCAIAVTAIVVLNPSPASAHGGSTADDTTNYRSTITEPGADGLSWRVLDGDGAIELTNTSGLEVIVIGYRGEPYLRFTPDGVHRNANSPATYLNEDRFGDAEVPPNATHTATPIWEQVAGGSTFAWHDHRAHWMSRTDPPQVATDPSRKQLVSTYEIPLVINDPAASRNVAAHGQLHWLPDAAWWPPLLILGLTFLILSSAIALATQPSHDRWRTLARSVAGIVAVVVGANIVRTIDGLSSYPTSVVSR